MISPDRQMHDTFNRDLQREQENDINDLNVFVGTNAAKLNIQQKMLMIQ